jgi:hypothetical protein
VTALFKPLPGNARLIVKAINSSVAVHRKMNAAHSEKALNATLLSITKDRVKESGRAQNVGSSHSYTTQTLNDRLEQKSWK